MSIIVNTQTNEDWSNEWQLVETWLRTDLTQEGIRQSCEQIGRMLTGPEEVKWRVAVLLLEVATDRSQRLTKRLFALQNLSMCSSSLGIRGSKEIAKGHGIRISVCLSFDYVRSAS